MIRTDLNLNQIRASLKGSSIGHFTDFYPAVDSTMKLAHAAAKSMPMPSGLVITTDLQTNGRGRMNRSWDTPSGKALLLSILLGPELLPSHLTLLPMLAAVAVRRSIIAAVPALSDQIGLKWPNDVLGGADAYKVAGILIESAFEAGEIQYGVVGIGINVNQAPEELPDVLPQATKPTSLYNLSGALVDRTTLLTRLCESLCALVNSAMDDYAAQTLIWQEWRGNLQTIGKQVTVRQVIAPQKATDSLHTHPIGHDSSSSSGFSGVAVDVTPDGQLIVEDSLGKRKTFGSGEATLRSS